MAEDKKETPKEGPLVDDADNKSVPIIDVIESPDGRPEMYLAGYKYPHKGYPDNIKVQTLANVKKVIQSALTHLVIKPIVFPVLFMCLISKKAYKKITDALIDYTIGVIYPAIKKLRDAPKKYCPAVREVYRIFTLAIEREKSKQMKVRWRRMRDSFCFLLEYDSAYRYRFQDIMGEADISQFKLDEGDKYYTLMRKDYDFGGVEFNSRKKELQEIHDDWWQERQEKEEKIKDYSGEFEKELRALLIKYQAEMKMEIQYRSDSMIPVLGLKWKDMDKMTEEQIKERNNEMLPKFQPEFDEICKKYKVVPEVFFIPPPGIIQPQLRFKMLEEIK